MKARLVLAVLVAVPALLAAGVSIPHAFSNDTVADAAQVNANFGALKTAINGLDTRVMTGEVVLRSAAGTRCTRVHVKDGSHAVVPLPVDCTTLAPLTLVTDAGGFKYPDLTIARSCREYRTSPAYAGQGDGSYWIDPDGDDGNASFIAFCDMTTDGGGWTFFAHVNSNYVGATLFTRNVGAYRADRSDDNTTYGIGGTVLQALPHTEMMVTLDGTSVSAADTANKLVFFRYPVGTFGFNNGPVPCFGLGYTGWSYRVNASGAWTHGGESNACDGGAWYTRNTANSQYLVLFNNGSSYGNYWGAGIGGNDTWNHDGWWYAR